MKKISRAFIPFILIGAGACQNTQTAPAQKIQTLAHTPISISKDTTAGMPTKSQQANVWVCKSAGAKRYHLNSECGGLGRCKHEIEKMSIRDAEAIGLTQCTFKKCN